MALRTLRSSAARVLQARPSRPMATASRHVSVSGYLFPRAKSSGPGGAPDAIPSSELGVGELQGATFKIEPLRRVGEDPTTMRARLLYQSRKRGTLESDLILSTFAQAQLPTMTPPQLAQYDLFMDENDWDIYYWVTQEPPAAGSSDPAAASPSSPPQAVQQSPRPAEWAQTVGTFKPAYRPVPSRWKDSEILALLRQHVKDRGMGKGGMAFMPSLDA